MKILKVLEFVSTKDFTVLITHAIRTWQHHIGLEFLKVPAPPEKCCMHFDNRKSNFELKTMKILKVRNLSVLRFSQSF
jgi:hypothetical protein